MEKTCPCGKTIFVKPYLIQRKKYCSRQCQFKYHSRPSGLKYIITKENPTSFKKGQTPWNKGVKCSDDVKRAISIANKGKRHSIKTEFTSIGTKGDKNPKWKAGKVGYFASHGWIQRNYGKASFCENKDARLGFVCKKKSKNYDWAFINKKGYARDREQYIQLCHSCHLKYDKRK